MDPAGIPVPPEGPEPRYSFVWHAGLLLRRGRRGDRICVPSSDELRRRELEELHAKPLGGHFGRDKTLALARRLVWWP